MTTVPSIPLHGATDAGPEPRLDFSSNAHPLGPCPAALAAVRSADPTRYPDPTYAKTRATLGRLHGVDPDRIVVGTGAAELIHRIVRTRGGTVQHAVPGFGEYAHAAACAGLPVATFASEAAPSPLPGTLFVCVPNNPDGVLPDPARLGAIARACDASDALLALDLAYLPFLESPPPLPASALQLHAPNKAMGLVGIRAAYAIAPSADMGRILSSLGPSWSVGADGCAFLESLAAPQTRDWLAATAPTARRLRGTLADALRGLGFETRESAATHLVARHPDWPDASALTRAWRSAGVRVRDTASMGLPGWIRMAARPEKEIGELVGIGLPGRP